MFSSSARKQWEKKIITDQSHPRQKIFELFPSSRCFRSMCIKTSRQEEQIVSSFVPSHECLIFPQTETWLCPCTQGVRDVFLCNVVFLLNLKYSVIGVYVIHFHILNVCYITSVMFVIVKVYRVWVQILFFMYTWPIKHNSDSTNMTSLFVML